MNIDVYPRYGKILDSKISGSTVIVVDVLRTTTCIICAVKNGADKVVPTSDAGEAASIYGRLGNIDCVLAGEVMGIKHPDYDIGNSPFEFSEEVVSGKTIVVSTSNGTAAIHGVKGAKRVLLGAMINRAAVAKKAAEYGDDIIIVCAGTDGAISADDLCAAGAISNAIMNYAKASVDKITESDISFVCRNLYKNWKKGDIDLSKTTHWSRLVSLGFEKDIEYCFTADTTEVVPIYDNGIISGLK